MKAKLLFLALSLALLVFVVPRTADTCVTPLAHWNDFGFGSFGIVGGTNLPSALSSAIPTAASYWNGGCSGAGTAFPQVISGECATENCERITIQYFNSASPDGRCVRYSQALSAEMSSVIYFYASADGKPCEDNI